MNFTLNTQAVLLLTSWFSKTAKTDPKPLSPSEWGRFAHWLKDQEKTPGGLLESTSINDYLAGWTDAKVTMERIKYLLGRSVALSLAWEKWQRAGLWVVTRSDSDYPSRLKKLLKADAPPVLFGCGNRRILDKGGIAMVGARDATPEQLKETSSIAGKAAKQGYSVISGGARGVDEAAMLGALENEGTVIGILSDNLLRTATSAKYRNALMSKNLVLISTFNPEAGFDVGNAMARNKYIYCLSDAAIVVATGKGSGGTWSGAIENMKKGWVPLWILNHPDKNSGNAALVQQGAKWLPEGDFNALIVTSEKMPPVQQAEVETSLFDVSTLHMQEVVLSQFEQSIQDNMICDVVESYDLVEQKSFFDFFLHRLHTTMSEKYVTLEQLLDEYDLNKSQLSEWLKRGISEKKIQKLSNPVRYMLVKEKQQILGI